MVFDLWKRPTIKWDLECEWGGTHRDQAIKMFDIDIKEDKPLLLATSATCTTGANLIGTFGFLGFCVAGTVVICCAANDEPD